MLYYLPLFPNFWKFCLNGMRPLFYNLTGTRGNCALFSYTFRTLIHAAIPEFFALRKNVRGKFLRNTQVHIFINYFLRRSYWWTCTPQLGQRNTSKILWSSNQSAGLEKVKRFIPFLTCSLHLDLVCVLVRRYAIRLCELFIRLFIHNSHLAISYKQTLAKQVCRLILFT